MSLNGGDCVQRWSTADVPQSKRLDYFASAITEAVYPLGVDHADPKTFRADVRFAPLGTIGVCKTVGSPHASFRRQRELVRTDDHTFNLLMVLDASWTAEHGVRMQMLPRDVLVIDSELPLETDIRSSFTAICVTAPDAWIRHWLPHPSALTARRIPGDSLWGRALSSYVSELSPELVAAPPLPLSVLADQVGSLLALTASGLHGAASVYTPAVRSLLERIQDCIAQRCTETELTAADVASSLNISVRTLHRAFSVANQTFGARLIEARARVAERMLSSPLFNRITTAEIGRRAGFVSASHFVRVMRSRRGRTPLQLRHDAYQGEHSARVARSGSKPFEH